MWGKCVGSGEGNVVGIVRFCDFCTGEKWRGYWSGLNWLTVEATEMLGFGEGDEGAHIHGVVVEQIIEGTGR